MDKKLKVLFISPWYPNRHDTMSGLFVQKHAEAVNLYCDVKVLFICHDDNIDDYEIVNHTHNNLHEIILYYPTVNGIFHKPIKILNYVKAYWKGYKYLRQIGFIPDIVHVNVLTRTGFIAYLYKKWKGTSYVITEHWTRYLPEHFHYNGFLRKKITELVVKNASAIMPVSSILQREMQKLNLKNQNYIIVSNVVSDIFFDSMEKERRKLKRILHISCFLESAKNVMGITRATRMLVEERDDFELVIIGNGPDFNKCTDFYRSLNFPSDTIKFIGEKTPDEVAWWFKNSDMFVLFSNYETAGVVIMESLASGVPVIATPTGIVPDEINETNGYIVDFRDEKQLKEKMDKMLDNYHNYNTENICKNAIQKYSYNSVGKNIFSIYTKILNYEN